MKTKIINRVISIILIICIICPSFSFGVDTSKEDAWLSEIISESKPITQINYQYDDDKEDFTYMLYLKVPEGSSSGIHMREIGGPGKSGKYEIVDTSTNPETTYAVSVGCVNDEIAANSEVIYIEDEKSYYIQMSFGKDLMENGSVKAYAEQREMSTIGGDLVITLTSNTNSSKTASTVIAKSDISGKVKEQSSNSNSTGGLLGFLKSVGEFLLNLVVNTVETLINGLLLTFGDGLLHRFCLFIGETVTIESLIFGDVAKVSIDFWDETALAANSVGSIMKSTVNYWFSAFRTIAVLVYVILLAYVALKIILASTGREKEKYKTAIKDWIVGVVLLFLFPYVMKYTVELNNALVKSIQRQYEKAVNEEPGEEFKSLTVEQLKKIDDRDYGTNRFYKSMNGGSEDISTSNTMLYIRKLAGRKNKIALTAIYYIMIVQTVAVLCVYYKRVFMLAFLITIFPLVAMTYIVDKMGDGKSQSFSIWTKEFIINVFVQTFHAIVFALLTSSGIREYIQNDNWLFMVMSVVFLFQGEKILRAIFSAKSATGSIGDLATAGMAAYATAKALKQFKPKVDEEHESDFNDLEKSEKKIASAGGGVGQLSTVSNIVSSTGMQAPAISPAVGIAKIITKTAPKKIKVGRAVSGIIKATGSAIGTVNGLALGTAKGGNAAETLGDAYKGKELGKAVASVPAAAYKRKVDRIQGTRIKEQIASGEMDAELGLDQELNEKERDAKRAAYAAAAAKAAKEGATAAAAKYWKTYNKKTKH